MSPIYLLDAAGVSAVYVCMWPELNPDGSDEPLYQIVGGEYDGSSVVAKTLRELGIAVPEHEAEVTLPPERAIPSNIPDEDDREDDDDEASA